MGGIWKNTDDGTNITFSNWAVGYPDNSGNEACARITDTGVWVTSACSDNHPPRFLCGVHGDGSETGGDSATHP